MSLTVLHVREVDVPPNLHEVNVEHLKVHWYASKVEQLEQWPHLPICVHGRPELFVEFLLSNLQAIAFALIYENIEA